MKLYRYSPIEDKDQLIEAIKHIHSECYKLCGQSFGEYLQNAGNMGIFCHFEEEYERLIEIRKGMTKPSDDPNQKYFELIEPIVIPERDDIPEVTYTHLYIRKLDIYRAQVGDVDFFMERKQYDELKKSLLDGNNLSGARIFPRKDLDMIELFDPKIDVLAYVSTSTMAEKVRIKLSEETNL